jgi:hypothetical protein
MDVGACSTLPATRLRHAAGPGRGTPTPRPLLWRIGMAVGFAPRPRGRLQAPAGRA